MNRLAAVNGSNINGTKSSQVGIYFIIAGLENTYGFKNQHVRERMSQKGGEPMS